MPCKSWSLIARETCPGSIDPETKELVPPCEGCYAHNGNYRFSNVKKPRIHNREDWRQDDWVDAMVNLLTKETWFRWFDSGDVYHPQLAEKIFQVIQRTPNVNHWIPTRSYKIPRIAKILDKINDLPNAIVRFSSDSVRGEYIKGVHGSTIVGEDQIDELSSDITMCEAYTREGKCQDCRVCWDKSVSIVAYPQHGVSMKRVNREIIATSEV